MAVGDLQSKRHGQRQRVGRRGDGRVIVDSVPEHHGALTGCASKEE